MKLLLLPLLLAGAGVGWLGLGSSPAAADGCATDCRITVECLDGERCLVTCWEPDGSIGCQEEVACDEPCDRPCDVPCAPAGATAEAAPATEAPVCTPTRDCAR